MKATTASHFGAAGLLIASSFVTWAICGPQLHQRPTGIPVFALGSRIDAQASPPAQANVTQKPAPEDLAHRFDKAYLEESTDADWAPDATRTFEERVRKVVTQRTAIESIACKTTMCRLECLYENVKDYKAFGNAFQDRNASPWPDGYAFGSVKEVLNNGGVRLVLYVGRPGMGPPSLN